MEELLKTRLGVVSALKLLEVALSDLPLDYTSSRIDVLMLEAQTKLIEAKIELDKLLNPKS